MLTGKKFPMCMRALRMVVEALFTPDLQNTLSYDKLLDTLEEKVEQSRTSRL